MNTDTIALIACALALLAWGLTARKLIRVQHELVAANRHIAADDQLIAMLQAQLRRLTTRGKDGKFVKVEG